jgi:hypothetical protein
MQFRASYTVSSAGESPVTPDRRSRPDDSGAVLARVLEEVEHGLSTRDANEVLAECVRDLSGSAAATIPELAFRLMCERLKTGPRSRAVSVGQPGAGR